MNPSPPKGLWWGNWTWEKTHEAGVRGGSLGLVHIPRGCQEGSGWDRGLLGGRWLKSCHGGRDSLVCLGAWAGL